MLDRGSLLKIAIVSADQALMVVSFPQSIFCCYVHGSHLAMYNDCFKSKEDKICAKDKIEQQEEDDYFLCFRLRRSLASLQK